MTSIETLLKEAPLFFNPLNTATQNRESLNEFFHSFGFNLSDATSILLFEDFKNIGTNFSSLFNALNNSNNLQINDIVILTSGVLEDIKKITDNSSLQSFIGNGEDLVLEIFDFLTYLYLSTRIYLAESVLSGLGVIQTELIESTSMKGRQVDFVRVKFHWSRLGDFFQDTKKWAYDVYGWAGNPNSGDNKSFNHAKAIGYLVRLVHATGLSLVHQREVTNPAELGMFLKNGGSEKIFEAFLPIQQDVLVSFGEDDTPIFSKEAGFKIVPFGDFNQPEKLGLALAPYVKGGVSGKQQLSEKLTLDVAVDGQAAGGAYLSITPDGINVIGGGAIDALFKFSFNFQNTDQTPTMLVGDSQSTRLQADAIIAKVGGNMNGDLYLASGLKNFKVVVDFKEDDILGTLVSQPIMIDPGDIIIGWKTERGFYFEGGTSLDFKVPLHIDMGLLSIIELGILLKWDNDFTISILVSAQAKFGPLYLSTKNTGINLGLGSSPNLDGLLGRYDIQYGFKSPSSYGIAIDSSVVKGGGFLDINPDKGEYTGVIELSIKNKIALKAIGIITTKLPNGEEGYSLLLLITAEFNPLQLGFGFTLNGVGGLIAVNRGMNLAAIRVGVQNKTLDHILFPDDPVANAPQIIANLNSIFPIAEGNHSFGLMFLIGWGVPSLLEVELGLMISFPSNDLAVIGKLSTVLPDKKKPVLVLNVDFAATLSFENKYFYFDARIENTSHLLSYTLSGDMAVRMLWGNHPNFVLSVGGFNPDFAIPKGLGLDNMERITLNLLADDNPRLILKCYFAITSNTVQFGATIDFYFKKSKYKVIGFFYFHALFQFDPFYFIVSIGAALDVKVGSKSILSVGVEGNLEGPTPWKVKGKGKFKIWFVKISVSFSKTWGEQIDTSLPDIAVFPELKKALLDDRNWAALLPEHSTLTTLRDIKDDINTETEEQDDLITHPFGSLSLTQRVVPLNITIDKYGGQKPGDYKKFSISFEIDGDEIDTNPVRDFFAPAQFFALSDDQKISKSSYEKYTAGISDDSENLHSNFKREKAVIYEFKSIDSIEESNTAKGIVPEPASHLAHWAKGTAIAKSQLGRQTNLKKLGSGKQIKYTDEEFVIVHQEDLSFFPEVGTGSEFEIQSMLDDLLAEKPEMEDKLMVVPAYEII